jgi:hypothetical protein
MLLVTLQPGRGALAIWVLREATTVHDRIVDHEGRVTLIGEQRREADQGFFDQGKVTAQRAPRLPR